MGHPKDWDDQNSQDGPTHRIYPSSLTARPRKYVTDGSRGPDNPENTSRFGSIPWQARGSPAGRRWRRLRPGPIWDDELAPDERTGPYSSQPSRQLVLHHPPESSVSSKSDRLDPVLSWIGLLAGMVGAGSTGRGRPVRRLPASTPCRSARTATGPGKPEAPSRPFKRICRRFTYFTAIGLSHAPGGGPAS